MFDRQNKKEHNLIVEKSHKNVDHTSNTNSILHVPERVNHTSVPVTNTDRRPRKPTTDQNTHVPARVSLGLVPTNKKPDRLKNIEQVPSRKLFNDKKQVSKCERKPAEITIPSPLSQLPNGTII